MSIISEKQFFGPSVILFASARSNIVTVERYSVAVESCIEVSLFNKTAISEKIQVPRNVRENVDL